MQTTLSQQIKAIQVARGILEKLSVNPMLSINVGNFEKGLIAEVDKALNDAGATLASLNMITPAFIKELEKDQTYDAYITARNFFESVNKANNPQPNEPN